MASLHCSGYIFPEYIILSNLKQNRKTGFHVALEWKVQMSANTGMNLQISQFRHPSVAHIYLLVYRKEKTYLMQ
jgi:hypothetical protein